jgi:hypothetical protein
MRSRPNQKGNMSNRFNRGTVRTLTGMLLALCFSLLTCAAQENKVDLSALTRETQQTSHKEHDLTIVWWIPDDFWRVAMSVNGDVTPNQIERVIKVVHPYTLVAVVEGEFGPFGGTTYKSEKSIREQLTILDAKGNSYKPMDVADASPDLQNLLASMKPMLSNMLGPMGKNFNFYVFPGTTKDKKSIASAKEESTFTVQNGDEAFKWRLPLGSLLPPKTCVKCGEKLNGAFKFCPFDGTALK